jgi:hypothetical protein
MLCGCPAVGLAYSRYWEARPRAPVRSRTDDLDESRERDPPRRPREPGRFYLRGRVERFGNGQQTFRIADVCDPAGGSVGRAKQILDGSWGPDPTNHPRSTEGRRGVGGAALRRADRHAGTPPRRRRSASQRVRTVGRPGTVGASHRSALHRDRAPRTVVRPARSDALARSAPHTGRALHRDRTPRTGRRSTGIGRPARSDASRSGERAEASGSWMIWAIPTTWPSRRPKSSKIHTARAVQGGRPWATTNWWCHAARTWRHRGANTWRHRAHPSRVGASTPRRLSRRR